jgi:hypothetical protein
VWILLENVLEAFLDERHYGMRGCDATLKTTEGIKSVVEAKKESAKIGGDTERMLWLLPHDEAMVVEAKLQVRGCVERFGK